MSKVSKELFKKIMDVFPDLLTLKIKETEIYKAKNYQDIRVLPLQNDRKHFVAAISRFESGFDGSDKLPFQQMQVLLYPKTKTAEVVSFKNQTEFHLVHPVTIDTSLPKKVELTKKLVDWLSEIKLKGYNRGSDGQGLQK